MCTARRTDTCASSAVQRGLYVLAATSTTIGIAHLLLVTEALDLPAAA
jgi:hypothetical protein